MPSPIADIKLHLVTDRTLCTDGSLEEAVAQAIDGGVEAVHLRERGMPAGELYDLARRLRKITLGKALLIINDRVDVALAIPADGVHLPSNSVPVYVAKKLGADLLLVGRSAHTVEQAVEARIQEADYVFLGTMFESDSHPGFPPVGPGLIREVKSKVDLPLFGIGGINASNAGQVMEAGASGIAVIRSILTAPNRKRGARELVQAVQQTPP